MSNSLDNFTSTIPPIFKPQSNFVMNALLQAVAAALDQASSDVALGKQQLFVPTATGNNLNILAKSLGVSRPETLGLQDSDFQQLIPNLSLKPRNIKKAFYDTADVFWGPLFSRANVTSLNVAPYDLNVGDTFEVAVDNGATQIVTVVSGDVQSLGAATALEVQSILSRVNGITVEVLTDPSTSDQSVNIRTNTPGSVGVVEIVGGTGFISTKLNIVGGKYTILSLDQRVSIYNVNPNELIIEIPAVVPALRKVLRGSHHFHQDATLASPVAPDDGTWVGSFMYDPNGVEETVTITSQRCNLQQTINKNSVAVGIAVDDNSSFESPYGQLFIGYGTESQEGPVTFRGLPNKNTILIDPGYKFKNDQSAGTTINVISQNKPYTPRIDGSDYPIYVTSPSEARAIVQQILQSLAAAGIILTFVILAPTYKYLITNPYLENVSVD